MMTKLNGKLKLAIGLLQVLLRLLVSWPRLRREAKEALQAATVAYKALWEALEDRELTREEVAQLREKVQAVGREVEDVAEVLAEVVGLKHALSEAEGEETS